MNFEIQHPCDESLNYFVIEAAKGFIISDQKGKLRTFKMEVQNKFLQELYNLVDEYFKGER